MKRIGAAGLYLLLTLSLTTPTRAQRGGGGGGGGGFGGGEDGAYDRIRQETNLRNKLDLIASFLNAYKSSGYRPELDIQLMTLYIQYQRFSDAILKADTFHVDVPRATPQEKVQFYTYAMIAAGQVKDNNGTKVAEFGERALQADPMALNPLIMLAALVTDRPLPKEAPAKEATLNKALDYGQRIMQAPKGSMSDEEWQRAQARAHSTVGLVQLTREKYPEAVSELTQAVKLNPKDQNSQSRLAGALMKTAETYIAALQKVGPELQAAIKAVNDAAAAKDEKKYNELAAKYEELTKQFNERRDQALDTLGTAVALGVKAARATLENVYQYKGNGLEGIDQFIESRKKELGL